MFGKNIGDGLTWLFMMCCLGVAVVIFGLGGWAYYQSNKIDNLNAEIEMHLKTINIQSNTITQLKADVEYNRQLTLELSKAESDVRSKTNEIVKSISRQVKDSEAFNADAPNSVIEFLRK
ncbi:hypothetical protein CFY87_03735 [Actinobacillus seminis]|uniref:Protein of uncharacterized function (DUF2570) n=1 Tax=Actinobacillus seminis TaxID=722 RepID=A0A263HFB9_9PAST|nr:DUF2570 family protein [Actinobacillus seminis]OZN25266.1 hypothetical protein CFY87_03735 [Actinobacillus seminis]SUU35992.1 Protein of uncharacterised function (DUF2570) [Actinobacillus seminis]